MSDPRPSACRVSRRRLVIGSAMLGSMALGSRAPRAQQREPLRFGVALPTTGSAAPFGLDQVRAMQWAVEDINAAGGAGGRRLDPLVIDTQARPQTGVEVVTRMVSVERVPVIVIGWSAVIAASAPVANRSQTLMIPVGANSPRISGMGDYVYTAYPLADVDVVVLARYARERLNKQHAAVLHINDESGVYGARIFRERFEGMGGRIAAFESYEPNATDYTGAILKIRASNPDHVHLHGNAGDSPQAIQQLRQLGVTVPITSYSAAYNPAMVQRLGPLADGLIVASLAPGVDASPAVARYVQRWRTSQNREPNNLPATQYVHDAAYIIKALVERLDGSSRPLTGPNMRAALLEIGTFSLPLLGSLTINADHTVRSTVYLLEARGGQFRPLGAFT